MCVGVPDNIKRARVCAGRGAGLRNPPGLRAAEQRVKSWTGMQGCNQRRAEQEAGEPPRRTIASLTLTPIVFQSHLGGAKEKLES